MLNKKKASKATTAVDTLIITGNGFDIWQDLNTDYSQFKDHYLANRDSIIKKSELTDNWELVSEDGTKTSVGDVEMIYGDPFNPHELEAGFWNTFESSLGRVDSERLNYFFGKDDDGLKKLGITIENAQSTLKEAFCDWISTISIENKAPKYHFGDNCLFINFNYTDTLEKRLGVPHENVFHIHGEAAQKDSIVFGHALHPQPPIEQLYNMGGRFRGLFFVEGLLFGTDKHTYLHYMELLVFLARRGVRLTEIKNIYVLGHSFGSADLEYFEELAKACGAEPREEKAENHIGTDSLAALQLMISYVILTYGNDGPHPEFDRDAAEAFGQYIRRRQKDKIWRSVKKQYKLRSYVWLKDKNRLHGLEEVLSSLHDQAPANWHISYHSPKDKQSIEKVLRNNKVQNYSLYDTIDECIAPFHV